MNPTAQRLTAHVLNAVSVASMLYVPQRARRAPWPFRVVSFNLDWGLNEQAWTSDLAALIPLGDVLLLQEAKFLDVRAALEHLDPGVWEVFQDTGHRDRQGIAIAWRRSIFGAAPLNARYVLGTSHGHDQLLNRWFARVALRSVAHPDVVIPFEDGHRPPLRDRALWPAFDHVAQGMARRNPRRRAVLGIDLNEALRFDPLGLRAQGYRLTGHRIDGIYYKGLQLVSVVVGPKLHSDHRATIATLAA